MTAGVFAEWQPQYAARGIATFPVNGKRPAVRGYMRIGPDVSRQLALKFARNEAFGFALKRNRITVLDVDSSDERVLSDALGRHGRSPFVVRSGSGNFQAWYRRTRERRCVRPDPRQPIDILGDGYVVAPPSQGTRGHYEIIEGTLDDLQRLPELQNLEGAAGQPSDKIGMGRRNDTLFRFCMAEAHHCDDFNALLDVARTYAEDALLPQVTDNEIVRTAQSAWGYTVRGENRFGTGQVVTIDHNVIDALAAADPYALALLGLLRRNHWWRPTFILAKGMADHLGWTVSRFRAARDSLVNFGLIHCHRRGGRGRNDTPIYGWEKGVRFRPPIRNIHPPPLGQSSRVTDRVFAASPRAGSVGDSAACLPATVTSRGAQDFDTREVISTAEVARIAGRAERFIRNWAMECRIGRRVAGRWAISCVALDMLLAGDRESAVIVSYYGARGIASPLR